jgi:EAL domain-containing protein (putative c-di-GMP-specific phosphodiesterase class I)
VSSTSVLISPNRRPAHQPGSPPGPVLAGISLAPEPLAVQDLDRILDRSSQFAFHFQPIVDLLRGVTVGFEALARFSIAGGRIAPNLVFEAASKFDRRLDLEDMVVREALLTRRSLPANCFLSLNVGPAFLLSDRFDKLLYETDSLAGVVVEITEDEMIADYGLVKRKLAFIRAKGGLAAVDDAGSGYSSLKHVMEIRPNFIKLDRCFVSGCDTDPAKAVLIGMLGTAANRLDAWIIAEGVETIAELDELIRLGVPLAQGFYLARPEPAMRSLDPDKRTQLIQRAVAFATPTGIHRSVEQAIICTDRRDAELQLGTKPDGSVAVVLSTTGQPELAIERHPVLGIRGLSHLMRVQLGSDAHEVLSRALTRPQKQRYDPLIAIDELGQLQGVVHIDRLTRETLKLHSVS